MFSITRLNRRVRATAKTLERELNRKPAISIVLRAELFSCGRQRQQQSNQVSLPVSLCFLKDIALMKGNRCH